MKQIFLFCAAVLSFEVLQAQKLRESEVPVNVKNAFTKSFPDVKKVEWSKESDSEFEAEFKNGGLEQATNFDTSGNWIVTETEIKKSKLPAAVQASLKKEFAGYKIEEVEKVETPDKGMFYEVKVEKRELTYSVQISADGKILKKEEEKEGDDKD
jgi:hypothetical protein